MKYILKPLSFVNGGAAAALGFRLSTARIDETLASRTNLRTVAHGKPYRQEMPFMVLIPFSRPGFTSRSRGELGVPPFRHAKAHGNLNLVTW